MDIQEIIDLLEKAEKHHNNNCLLCARKDTLISHALAILKPLQVLQGLTGTVFEGEYPDYKPIPCPDCKQPEPTSLGNTIRRIANNSKCNETDKNIIHQAADRLDAWWKYIGELKEQIKQQPTAGEFTKKIRAKYDLVFEQRGYKKCRKDMLELCDRLDAETKIAQKSLEACTLANIENIKLQARLDRTEAINKKLLETCIKAFEESHNPKVEKVLEAAIAKAKKEGGE